MSARSSSSATQQGSDVAPLAALQSCTRNDAYHDELTELTHAQQSIVLECADPLCMLSGAADGTSLAQTPQSCGAVIDCSLVDALETSQNLDPTPTNSQPEACACAKNARNHADESFMLQTLDTPRLLSLMKSEEIEPDTVRKTMRQGRNHKPEGFEANGITDCASNQRSAIAHSSMADLCTNLSMHGVPSSSSSSSSSSPVPPLASVNASESASMAVASTNASPRHFGHNSSDDHPEFLATSPLRQSPGGSACQLKGPSASLRLAADCVAGPVSPGVACSPALAKFNAEVGSVPTSGATKDGSASSQGGISKSSLARCYCRFLHCWSSSAKASE